MLLYVINVVTTELMAPSLMKPTGSFDVKKTQGKIYVTQGKQREFHFGWNVATLKVEA